MRRLKQVLLWVVLLALVAGVGYLLMALALSALSPGSNAVRNRTAMVEVHVDWRAADLRLWVSGATVVAVAVGLQRRARRAWR